MEDSRNIIYSLEDFIMLNHGKSSNLEFFTQYTSPKTTFEAYNNSYNKRQKSNKIRETFIPIAKPFTAERVIEDIRKVINSVSLNKTEQPAALLNRMNIPVSQIPAISKLFHDSMISCDFLIDKYLELLCKFDNNNVEKADSIVVVGR